MLRRLRRCVVGRLGFVGLSVVLPLLVARVAGCRSRWLVRGSRRVLAVRCASPALAALLCRRARAFGLAPCRVSARFVLLPCARVAPFSHATRRCFGPPALVRSQAPTFHQFRLF